MVFFNRHQEQRLRESMSVPALLKGDTEEVCEEDADLGADWPAEFPSSSHFIQKVWVI